MKHRQSNAGLASRECYFSRIDWMDCCSYLQSFSGREEIVRELAPFINSIWQFPALCLFAGRRSIG